MKPNVHGRFATNISSWRKLSLGTWDAANDPTIYGMLSIDVTAANRMLADLNAGPVHVTMTHLVVKAIACTLASHPECNGFIRRGSVFLREQVDVFVLVAVAGNGDTDLSGIKIEQADRKSVVQIAEEVAAHAAEIRRGDDAALAGTKRLMSALPRWAIKPTLRLASFVQYELNLDLSALGVPRDPFGAAFVTSVGALGLGFAFPPIVPVTRLSVNVAPGTVRDEAVVVDGEIVIRPILPVTATFDHRMIDGHHASKLARTFREILESPASLLA
ncbi:MAG TPA: 2-oxo acid dehydrogenase subunit E2 [Polyangiaceae bacterium]|nr:2-oxo acid dehydrogenase subunit E2 [Polyangiaceae bacterium]